MCPIRVAVEGCGHGALDAIYSSVAESCQTKGWEGVDLVIIGGDFQAVRNQHDLNVVSMPHKYRKMADFHEYYSGAKKAPYLTIFIGGNHEASNHLFELYYGGWVAPNIYYMGAANMLRFGPLRIAGLSGIWDGRDYNKPHYERLPYNENDVVSIYHVRELDIRKLLSVRSQVDIGLSHDWPRGIEKLGDSEKLFRQKRGFQEDSLNGKLGNVAAKHCLERLRPAYWFSAHLHVKYTAAVEHENYEPVRRGRKEVIVPLAQIHPDPAIVDEDNGNNGTPGNIHGNHNVNGGAHAGVESPAANRNRRGLPNPTVDRPQVNAWQAFQEHARLQDAADAARHQEEEQRIRDEEARTGKKSHPLYKYEETFKQVTTDSDFNRTVTKVQTEEREAGSSSKISSLDGAASSRSKSLKRTRDDSNIDEIDIEESDEDTANPNTATTVPAALDGATVEAAASHNQMRNPDEIDLDTSEEERDSGTKMTNGGTSTCPNRQQADVDKKRSADSDTDPSDMDIDERAAGSGSEITHAETRANQNGNSTAVVEETNEGENRGSESPSTRNGDMGITSSDVTAENIPEDVRAQLAELSASFVAPKRVEVTAPLPLPAAVTNKTTHFLSLDKCEPGKKFLQLMELDPVSEQFGEKPLKLSYDPEWLAISRVFAPELALGERSNAPIPQHRGDMYYRDCIIMEEEWINQNVVKAGKLEIPENFEITAPVYDPSIPVGMRDMPREVTNPQTSAFCALIGIENPFDIPEEEREARVAPPAREHFHRGGRRGGFGGHGGERGQSYGDARRGIHGRGRSRGGRFGWYRSGK